MSLEPDWLHDSMDIQAAWNDRQVCQSKLANLVRRRQMYGDITQNVSEDQLQRLLLKHDNHVPKAIEELQLWVRRKGTSTFIPPKFYDKNGKFTQPKSFEMTISKPSDTEETQA